MSILTEKKGNKLIITVDLADKPYVSNSEAAKAAKDNRPAVATMLASSGGFVRLATGERLSLNVLAG